MLRAGGGKTADCGVWSLGGLNGDDGDDGSE